MNSLLKRISEQSRIPKLSGGCLIKPIFFMVMYLCAGLEADWPLNLKVMKLIFLVNL